jgi:Fe-S-cluster containining protein
MIIPECQKCGACCAYGPQWVAVTEEEASRLPSGMTEPAKPEKWTIYGRKIPFKVMTVIGSEDRCSALYGRIGREVSCSIYSKRPEMCRKFERGGPECTWLLGYYGIGEPIEACAPTEDTGTV